MKKLKLNSMRQKVRIKTMASKLPKPLFDNVEALENRCNLPQLTTAQNRDYHQSCQFLLCYKNNSMTFTAYRREIERLLQWSHLIAKKTLKQLHSNDIDSYVKFCQKPLKSWIGLLKTPRFINHNAYRVSNPKWRPFVATLPKAKTKIGIKPTTNDFSLSEKSLREIFTVSSSFFNYLIQENYIQNNPVSQLRQKSKYFAKQQTQRVVRKLPELQWGYVIETAQLMAKEDEAHERTLFIMNALYGMYLRISELVASENWVPQMGHFYRDNESLWWFKTRGKGNKERHIAVSQEMLKALKRWRKYLKLTPLPSSGETTPLIPKQLGVGPITSTRPIRRLAQDCFDRAVEHLEADGFAEDAEQLMHVTVHWLRHTGISEDVKHRPREHVRDDAGHSNSGITDRYIDVGLQERYQTARKKQIIPTGFEIEEED